MLDKPDIPDRTIATWVGDAYELPAVQVAFLPCGADRNTAVYRVVTSDRTPYFLKLRRSGFDKTSVALPRFLRDQGIVQVLAPIPTRTGQLWASVDAFTLTLYPFVQGHDGYDIPLSNGNWVDLGRTIRAIHTSELPHALFACIQQETYSPQWREFVKTFLERVKVDTFDDPISKRLAAFLKARREETLDLVERAERLAIVLSVRSPEFVLCHSDIHAGNVLIDARGDFFLVDWDNPIQALKERDLMSIGAGLMGAWRTAEEEESLFYQGYGRTEIDPRALAYYRYERIVQDIAVFSDRILLAVEDLADREQSLRYLQSSFLPNGAIQAAYKGDKTWRAS